MEIRVRRATLSDVEIASVLFGHYLDFYGAGADPQRVRSFLGTRVKRRESIILLAEERSEPAVGFAQIYPTFSSLLLAPVWILNDLFVLPRARRAGVARALIGACVAEAKRAGVVAIELKSARDNHAARQLYETEGFERETTFECYQRRSHIWSKQ